MKKNLFALLPILLFIFPLSCFGGSFVLSTTQPGATATLDAVANFTLCPDNQTRSVVQFDLTALTLNDQGTMVGNLPPVVDLSDIKIESLVIAGQTITNYPVISKSSWGYSYKIDPPINFGSNDNAVIKVSNVKIASSGKAKVWFALIHRGGNPLGCISGRTTIDTGAFNAPSLTPIPATATPIPPTPTAAIKKVSKNTQTRINNSKKSSSSAIRYFSQFKKFILSLFNIFHSQSD